MPATKGCNIPAIVATPVPLSVKVRPAGRVPESSVRATPVPVVVTSKDIECPALALIVPPEVIFTLEPTKTFIVIFAVPALFVA